MVNDGFGGYKGSRASLLMEVPLGTVQELRLLKFQLYVLSSSSIPIGWSSGDLLCFRSWHIQIGRNLLSESAITALHSWKIFPVLILNLVFTK